MGRHGKGIKSVDTSDENYLAAQLRCENQRTRREKRGEGVKHCQIVHCRRVLIKKMDVSRWLTQPRCDGDGT